MDYSNKGEPLTMQGVIDNLNLVKAYLEQTANEPLLPRQFPGTTLEYHLSMAAHGHPYGPVIVHPDELDRLKALLADESR